MGKWTMPRWRAEQEAVLVNLAVSPLAVATATDLMARQFNEGGWGPEFWQSLDGPVLAPSR